LEDLRAWTNGLYSPGNEEDVMIAESEHEKQTTLSPRKVLLTSSTLVAASAMGSAAVVQTALAQAKPSDRMTRPRAD